MLAPHLVQPAAVDALPCRPRVFVQGGFPARNAINDVKVRDRRARAAFELDPSVAILQHTQYRVGAFRALCVDAHVDRAACLASPFGRIAHLDAFVGRRNAAFLAFYRLLRGTKRQRRIGERDF